MKMVEDERNESNQPLLGGMNLKTSIASKEIYADVNGVFTTGFFMVAFGMVLTFPVMLSLSKNNTIIEDVSWVYSKEANMDLYAGIQRVVIYLPAAEAYGLDYDAIECTPEFCEECLHSSRWIIWLLVIAYATWATDLLAIFWRHRDDSTSSQSLACVSSLLGIVCSIAALSLYVDYCRDALPNGDNKYLDTHGANLKYGAAFILTIIGFIFMKLLLFLGHIAFATVADDPVEVGECGIPIVDHDDVEVKQNANTVNMPIGSLASA